MNWYDVYRSGMARCRDYICGAWFDRLPQVMMWIVWYDLWNKFHYNGHLIWYSLLYTYVLLLLLLLLLSSSLLLFPSCITGRGTTPIFGRFIGVVQRRLTCHLCSLRTPTLSISKVLWQLLIEYVSCICIYIYTHIHIYIYMYTP